MPRTPATIVVLEDNAAAQELIDQALRRSGDRILISNNPLEALGLSSRVRIDLLVGDVGRLERSGPKVVEKLRSVAQVLYTNVPGGSRLTEQDSGTALSSPFSLEELKEAVAAALDDHR
jgi:two-component system response regulator PrrA